MLVCVDTGGLRTREGLRTPRVKASQYILLPVEWTDDLFIKPALDRLIPVTLPLEQRFVPVLLPLERQFLLLDFHFLDSLAHDDTG